MEGITLKNISKSFGENQVLSSISLTIEKGEIFGLLGPSGAGKTTLIKILTGQLKADSGEAFLLDTDALKSNRDINKKIGMVLDNSGLYERLSVYDNLLIYANIYGLPREDIDKALIKVDLKEAKKTAAAKLSKGMKQRLILARAILNRPQILFLDEPTSGLDPATSRQLYKLFFELKGEGVTIFLTTHDMEEATRLCGRIAMLSDGKIVESGCPKAICRKYNRENRISILTGSGETLVLPNSKESVKEIERRLMNEDINTIHSSEPNLEEVFIMLTGKELIQ